jgi:mono/diheme cytochrome c family protein
MNFNIRSLFSLLFFSLLSVPVITNAQADREGNHCAISKSPYRIAMDSGKAIYASHCVSCHQEDGKGIVSQCPSLNGKLVTGDKRSLIEILITNHVSSEELTDNTSPYVKPVNPEMSDYEIAYVLTYIRNNFGNRASAVKVSEVKSQRRN